MSEDKKVEYTDEDIERIAQEHWDRQQRIKKQTDDFLARLHKEDVESVAKAKETKCNVTHLAFTEDRAYKDSYYGAKCGDWVRIRPCKENKTYLGVYIGEIALSMYVKYLAMSLTEDGPRPDYEADPENYKKPHAMQISHSMYNPAIYVPELKRVVMGIESWWGVIDTPEQLKEISDETIDGVWYVQALKSISEKPVEEDQ